MAEDIVAELRKLLEDLLIPDLKPIARKLDDPQEQFQSRNARLKASHS